MARKTSTAVVTLNGQAVAPIPADMLARIQNTFGTSGEVHARRIAIVGELKEAGYSIRGAVYAVTLASGKGTAPDGFSKSNVERYTRAYAVTVDDSMPPFDADDAATAAEALYTLARDAKTLKAAIATAGKARTPRTFLASLVKSAAAVNAERNAKSAQAIVDGGQRATGGSTDVIERTDDDADDAAQPTTPLATTADDVKALGKYGTQALIAALVARFSTETATIHADDAAALAVLTALVEDMEVVGAQI